MRAQRVYENNKFQKGKIPVGLSTPEGQEYILDKLKKLGIKTFFEWDSSGDQLKRFVKNFHLIFPFIELLHDVGVKYEDMMVSHWHQISVKPWKIKSGNNIIANALTEKDANLVLDVLKRFTEKRGEWAIEKEKDGLANLNLSWYDDVMSQNHPNEDWYKGNNNFEFVKNLKDSRKKYDII